MARVLLLILLLGIPVLAQPGETHRPGRYQSPPKAKGITLLSVWGYPEQQAALGPTAAITPDGRFALFAGGGTSDADGATEDSFLGLWDVAGGRLVKEIKVPQMAVTALALSADGKFARAGLVKTERGGKETYHDGAWSLDTPKDMKHVGDRKHPVAALVFRPDGKRVLESSPNGSAQLWDVDQTKPVASFDVPNGKPVFALAFHPDPDKVLTSAGSEIGRAHV